MPSRSRQESRWMRLGHARRRCRHLIRHLHSTGGRARNHRPPALRSPVPVIASEDIRAAFVRCSQTIERHQAYLTRLDAVLGDGDHGDNLALGFRAVCESIDQADPATPPGPLIRQRRLHPRGIGRRGVGSAVRDGPHPGRPCRRRRRDPGCFDPRPDARGGCVGARGARPLWRRRQDDLRRTPAGRRCLPRGVRPRRAAGRLSRCRGWCRLAWDAPNARPRRAARPRASPRPALGGAPRPGRGVVRPAPPRAGPEPGP